MKTIFIVMAAVLGLAGVSSAGLTLAENGKSDYMIVIPAKPPASVTDAAAELQKDIQLATGAKLPIVKDGDRAGGTFISLGSTRQAKDAGLSADNIPDSGFRILTRNDDLYIIGLDTVAKVKMSRKGYGDMTPQPDIPGPQYTKDGGFSNGTANGVYTFLEDYLKVQWLMPGDIGRDVPARATFTIDDIDRTESPIFIYRNLIILEKYTSNNPQVHAWMNRQKLGFSFRLNHGHNWIRTVPASLYEEHPDWFAMIDGKRPRPTGRYKLETTNPELVRYFADQAVKAFKADPRQNTFSLSPSDSRGYSESPASKALYDPLPPGSDHPSITPLILKWYRDVSNAVAKMDPGAKLAGYLYQDYIFPPQKGDMTLPENFIPVIAPSFDYGYTLYRKETRKTFEQVMGSWSKIAPSTWFYYDLPNQIFRFPDGMVTPPATEILNFIFPRLLKYHIKGALFYGNIAWSQSAITNYIDAKLLWDPKLDAVRLRNEWLDRAYGPKAGAVMERFYDTLNSAFKDYYQKNASARYHAEERMFKNLFGPIYPELERLYLEAEAQPMSEGQKQRLQLIGDNLSVLQWRLGNAGYLPRGYAAQDSPMKRTDAQVAELLFPDKQTLPFDEFPILWYQNQPKLTSVKVALNQDVGPTNEKLSYNDGYILIYADRDQTVVIHPTNVRPQSSFLGYRIYEQEGGKYRIAAENLLYSGGTIAFAAKGKTLYCLRIIPQGTIPQGMAESSVRYQLAIPNALAATGVYSGNTLFLKGDPNKSLFVFASESTPLSVQDDDLGVTVLTQGAADAVRQKMMKRYPNLKLLQKLDDGWRFKVDPAKTGQKLGYAGSDLNDGSWDEITALDWWQNQGFEDYHGTAWYRRTFEVSKLPSGGKPMLLFGAVDGNTVVYLNGKEIGGHQLSETGDGWDKPFILNAASALKTGRNVLAVQVTKSQHMSGIYKGVSLLASDQ